MSRKDKLILILLTVIAVGLWGGVVYSYKVATPEDRYISCLKSWTHKDNCDALYEIRKAKEKNK